MNNLYKIIYDYVLSKRIEDEPARNIKLPYRTYCGWYWEEEGDVQLSMKPVEESETGHGIILLLSKCSVQRKGIDRDSRIAIEDSANVGPIFRQRAESFIQSNDLVYLKDIGECQFGHEYLCAIPSQFLNELFFESDKKTQDNQVETTQEGAKVVEPSLFRDIDFEFNSEPKMKNFVAIDFETANRSRSSICQIGITEVVNGVPQKSLSWLVQPEGNYYEPRNIDVHHITPADTQHCPSFPEVWPLIKPYLEGKTVVAHNTSFDMYALRAALDKYELEYPTFEYYCSLRLARYLIKGLYSYSLNVVLYHLGIDFGTHHKADDDSLGCANLFLKCLDLAGCEIEDLEKRFLFHKGQFAPSFFRSQLSTKKKSGGSKKFDYQANPDTFDEGNYFYGKTVCFTGTCQYGTRHEMLKLIADIGGIPVQNVSSKTDVLVVGQQDYRIVGEDGLSNKQKMAFQLLEKGNDIEILSELEFHDRY